MTSCLALPSSARAVPEQRPSTAAIAMLALLAKLSLGFGSMGMDMTGTNTDGDPGFCVCGNYPLYSTMNGAGPPTLGKGPFLSTRFWREGATTTTMRSSVSVIQATTET